MYLYCIFTLVCMYIYSWNCAKVYILSQKKREIALDHFTMQTRENRDIMQIFALFTVNLSTVTSLSQPQLTLIWKTPTLIWKM